MNSTTNPVSWQELEATPQWRDLTPQQRAYCRALVTNGGDPRGATEVAYNCKSAKNAVCLSYEIRKHPNVTAFIELYNVLTYGPPSREQQIANLMETIRTAPSYAKVRGQKLLAEMTGVLVASPDDPETDNPSETDSAQLVSKVGDVILQDGQKYRVTAVNENGIATDGDLIETV